MKILLFLLLLLFFQIQSLFSQIKTRGTLEIGYEDRIVMMDDGNGNSNSTSLLRHMEFADLHFDLTRKNLFIYTSVKSHFKPLKAYEYQPFQVAYYIGLSYNVKRFSFGYEHLCSHSIIDQGALTHPYFYDAYDKLSVKVTLWDGLIDFKK